MKTYLRGFKLLIFMAANKDLFMKARDCWLRVGENYYLGLNDELLEYGYNIQKICNDKQVNWNWGDVEDAFKAGWGE